MKILEPGKFKSLDKRCVVCGCLFRFDSRDLYTDLVSCPECGTIYQIDPELLEEEEENA